MASCSAECDSLRCLCLTSIVLGANPCPRATRCRHLRCIGLSSTGRDAHFCLPCLSRGGADFLHAQPLDMAAVRWRVDHGQTGLPCGAPRFTVHGGSATIATEMPNKMMQPPTALATLRVIRESFWGRLAEFGGGPMHIPLCKVRLSTARALQLGRQRLASLRAPPRRRPPALHRCSGMRESPRCRRLGHSRRCPPTQCRAALSPPALGAWQRLGAPGVLTKRGFILQLGVQVIHASTTHPDFSINGLTEPLNRTCRAAGYRQRC